MLQHQQDDDRANGIVEPDEHYTIKGVLKMMREERKEKKEEQQKKKTYNRAQEPAMRVRSFEDGKDGE